jgi:hypothetical protein
MWFKVISVINFFYTDPTQLHRQTCWRFNQSPTPKFSLIHRLKLQTVLGISLRISIITPSTLVKLCFTFLSFSISSYTEVEVSPPFPHKATEKEYYKHQFPNVHSEK